jgi:hypothetical protein
VDASVVEHADIQPERSPLSGRLFAVVGAVTTAGGVIEVEVAGNPTVVDLRVEEPLGVDGEGLRDTLDSIVADRRTIACIDLDRAGALGLIRLLTQAVEVRERILAKHRALGPNARERCVDAGE